MTGRDADFGIAEYDLATRDRIPALVKLVQECPPGRGLDVGIGTGYTTQAVLAGRPFACVDLHTPNLTYFRRLMSGRPESDIVFATATATHLPFRDGSFAVAMATEVLEHIDDDDALVRELARVLEPGGCLLVSVPYTGFGVTGLLELLRIPTVHDQPGPEFHVRPGYDEAGLTVLLARQGLTVAELRYCLRPATKLVVDLLSLGHLAYQRLVRRRRSWTWSDISDESGGVVFTAYRLFFPVLRLALVADRLLFRRTRGFGLVALARKTG